MSEWRFTQAAGIDPDGPGFQRIVIRPEITPGSGFDWVKASYRSIRGEVRSAWKRGKKTLDPEVTIPGNCRVRSTFRPRRLRAGPDAGVAYSGFTSR